MKSTLIIIAGNGSWKMATDGSAPSPLNASAPAESSPEEAAVIVRNALGAAGDSLHDLTLAIPSSWSLCAPVDSIDGSRAARRQAMLYDLETKLPVTAEEVVADFLPIDGEHSLAVATQIHFLQPFLQEFESEGAVISTISPAAMLAAQWYLHGRELPTCDGLLFSHDGAIEWLVVVGGRASQWYTLASDDDVILHLCLWAMRQNHLLRVVCSDIAEPMVARLRSIQGVEIIEAPLPPSETAAALAVQSAAEGNLTPWFQLRRDALGASNSYRHARRAIHAVMLAGIVFAVCLCTAMLLRASEYRRKSDNSVHSLNQVYAHVFAGKQPADGVDVSSRVASEERRLQALAGQSQEQPKRTSALSLLQHMLALLPADTQCKVDELRINGSSLFIEGTAPTHVDAAAFATSLSKGKAFQIDPPRTQLLPSGEGVVMTITANTDTMHPDRKEIP